MASDEPSASSGEPRVVEFRRRAPPATASGQRPEDLSKYQRSDEADDYRHRMLVNAVALVVVIGLIGAGYWLADTMARMRKNQDCVLSGRQGCTPVQVTKDRW